MKIIGWVIFVGALGGGAYDLYGELQRGGHLLALVGLLAVGFTLGIVAGSKAAIWALKGLVRSRAHVLETPTVQP